MSTTRRLSSSRWSASQSVATRGSRFSISLLLEDVVLAGVDLCQAAGLVSIVFAEASFDHLVLKVVFEDLDPTPRAPVELLHKVVAAEGALQALHSVLGPHLVHPALEAEP